MICPIIQEPAPIPPMGWNSWDCFGTSVTEEEVLANAEFMAEHLRSFGWDTVVVDIDWSDPTARAHGYNDGAPLAMDRYGRLIPDPGRFPSSADGAGFGPLADRVHGLGLKFGIHVMRGIPRHAVFEDLPILGTNVTARDVADRSNACGWNPDMFGLDHANTAARVYYESILALYTEWGVDFIKADDMLWPYQVEDIEAFSEAIQKCGRSMQLSLSPGRDLSLARLDHLRSHATMWRICDDLWDRWEDVAANFARFARWAPHSSELGWADGDMLPLGRIGLRAERGRPRDDELLPAERRTMMTLWVMARSPLMIGGHLPDSDPDTIALFTNAEVLEVLRSTNNREALREHDLVIWTAQGPGGARYGAVFNLGETVHRFVLDRQDLGFPPDDEGETQELWSRRSIHPLTQDPAPAGQQRVARRETIEVEIEPHGCQLMRFMPA